MLAGKMNIFNRNKESCDCDNLVDSLFINNDTHISFITDEVAELIDYCIKDQDVIVISNYSMVINSTKLTCVSANTLTLISQEDVIIPAEINITFNCPVKLKSGIRNKKDIGKVIFEGSNKQVFMQENNLLKIYYNPEITPDTYQQHKYHNPYGYFAHVSPINLVTSFMLVNDVQDLNDIQAFLGGNYALSDDIDASATKKWYPVCSRYSGECNNKGFKPLYWQERYMPFSGHFDGNGFCIENLYINRENEDNVGLFGGALGQEYQYSVIENLCFNNCSVVGSNKTALLIGDGLFVELSNIEVTNSQVKTKFFGGIVAGQLDSFTYRNISWENSSVTEIRVLGEHEKCIGNLSGVAKNIEDNCDVSLFCKCV